jgi:hypothetical protein
LEEAQEKLLKKGHLEAVMDSVGLKHVKRDTVDELCLKITTCWPRTLLDLIASSATLTFSATPSRLPPTSAVKSSSATSLYEVQKGHYVFCKECHHEMRNCRC